MILSFDSKRVQSINYKRLRFLKVKRDLTIIQAKYVPTMENDQLAVLKVIDFNIAF